MVVKVIFVHGVANRAGAEYEAKTAKRSELFQKFVFGTNVQIANPYWGEFGANPDGGYITLPTYDGSDGVESLGAGGTPTDNEDMPALIELAREDFPETVDLIFRGALEEDLTDETVQTAKLASDYALAVPKPSWLSADLNDDEFLKHLSEISREYAEQQGQDPGQDIEALGLGSAFVRGVRNLKDRVRNAGGRLALAVGRETAHTHVATFIGDVFSYLKAGAGREEIRSLLKQALLPAVETGDKIVLIGHSMGGVILADCLGDPAFCEEIGLVGSRKISALVTIGSQPGFFQELGLLSTTTNPRLSPVEHWLNIYDDLDVLSFRAKPVFEGNVTDLHFSSRTGLLDAHVAYFERIQFYRRLRSRLAALGVPTT